MAPTISVNVSGTCYLRVFLNPHKYLKIHNILKHHRSFKKHRDFEKTAIRIQFKVSSTNSKLFLRYLIQNVTVTIPFLLSHFRHPIRIFV